MRIGIAARAGLSTALAMTLMFAAPQAAHAGKATGCFYKGIYLAGKVQVVNNFADLKIQVVKNFPDIKVQQVRNFPNACGKWQFVNNFPDFKVQIVSNFPDIKVQFVNNFPGAM
jgi:acylphosphatase